MLDAMITFLRTLNELLTAGIAITAFSLLLYALSFNLRDRVARSFAIILVCVVMVFVGDAIGSACFYHDSTGILAAAAVGGLVFLPAAYLHFSDALLATTGRTFARPAQAGCAPDVPGFIGFPAVPAVGLAGGAAGAGCHPPRTCSAPGSPGFSPASTPWASSWPGSTCCAPTGARSPAPAAGA